MTSSIVKDTASMTTALVAARSYSNCSSWMMISSGAISD